MSRITPAHETLIDALAELVARDYLLEQASNDAACSGAEAERVLPQLDEAA